jgi:hypothetical protein
MLMALDRVHCKGLLSLSLSLLPVNQSNNENGMASLPRSLASSLCATSFEAVCAFSLSILTRLYYIMATTMSSLIVAVPLAIASTVISSLSKLHLPSKQPRPHMCRYIP